MTRLGVAGWPVAHSRSPAMHTAALRELGLADWTYQRLPIPPELFAETVRALPGAGFRGINVTIPHKEAALALADEASDTARAIGAANTLTFENGAILADNTDAPGLLAALPQPPAGRRVLVLGAGGSARAAVWALIQAGAAEVLVHNRTAERGEKLAADLGARAVPRPQPADILVNCTSVGLEDPEALPIPAEAVARFDLVVDLVYRDGATALTRAARHSVDGVQILVHQGALSLERWTGRNAPLAAMRSAALG